MTKSRVSCVFGHIYWKIRNGKLHFLCSVNAICAYAEIIKIFEHLIRVPKFDKKLLVVLNIEAICRLNFQKVENFHEVECTASRVTFEYESE